MILALIHCCLPMASRAIDGIPVMGNKWNDYVFILSTFQINALLFWANLYFICFIYTDFKRKETMMEFMSTLVDPRDRQLSKYGGFLPMMELYCPYNLHSWFTLREALLDFCKKYTDRIQTYSAFIILFYLLQFLLLAADLIFNLQFTFLRDTNMYISVAYETILIFIVVLLVINTGASVNSYFSTHK
jgi:hypothetical protein